MFVAFLILVSAFCIVISYPYFKKQAEKNYAGEEYDKQEIVAELMRCNYALYIDALEKKQNQKIDPLDIFYPDLRTMKVEDYYSDEESEISGYYEIADPEDFISYKRNFIDRFYSEYHSWENILNTIEGNWEYEVWDENGERILSSTDKDLRSIYEEERENYYLAFQYDINRRGFITAAKGIEAEEAQNILFENSDPIMERYYSYNYSQYNYFPEFSFQIPQNYTFIYSATEKGMESYKENRERSGYYYDNTAYLYVFFFIGIISIAGLILPGIKGSKIGKEKIFCVPLELVCTIFSCTLALIFSIVPDLIISVNDGEWMQTVLSRWNMTEQMAYFFVSIMNIIIWALIFLTWYWSVVCVRAVFSMGLLGYLKERCLICLICQWIGRQIKKIFGLGKKIYQSFVNIDLSDKATAVILKIVVVNFVIAAIISSFWFFGIIGLVIYSIVLFFILRKYYIDLQQKYYTLLKATNEIAEGNLDVVITEDLGVFEAFKGELERIQSGFKRAVEEELKSQRMKTDLITNVSHDLKTPLTAIITYVNLLKTENLEKEQQKAYIEILERKSTRLKVLIEDLFEISKATSKNVSLNLVDIDIVSLLKEVRLELYEKIEASGIEFRYDFPEEKIILLLDSQKTYRVFENLMVNITKYAMPHTRAYISLENRYDKIIISMKNVSAAELNVKPEELTERFVRGDQSRNTDGSGLGLAIAKSFVELQGGTMDLDVEADLFKVTITFPHNYEVYEEKLPEIRLEVQDIITEIQAKE